jgi:hypothetical protein
VTIITGYLTAVLLYVLYLAYCTLNRMNETKRLSQMPLVVRWHCTGILLAAVVVDVVFNVTFGSLLFVELPERKRLTFTMRCKKWLPYHGADAGRLVRWRGWLAHWICQSWLNTAEPGHC